MEKQKWIMVIAVMFLIMSSLYVGAFISKHRNTHSKPIYIDIYRGSHHRVERLYPQRQRIRILPFVDIEYNVRR